jgi:hypothetical protein
MRRIRILVLSAAFAGGGLQDPPKSAPTQQQTAPPQPQPQQPQAPQVDPRQQEQNRQQQIEQQRRQEERQRQQFMDSLFPDSRYRPNTPQYSKPFIAVAMQHDASFDLASIPLMQWLEKREIEEIPWRVEVEKARLRMDQRVEVAYSSAIDGKDLMRLGVDDLYLIAGIAHSNGEWLIPPKVVHQDKSAIPSGTDLLFSDAVFARSGEYLLSLVLYDRHTGRHNVEKRRVVVSNLEEGLLPNAGKQLSQAEFPALTDRENGSVLEFTNGLSLPVQNKRPVQIEVVSVLSPPEQWINRLPVVRQHNQYMASVLNTLSQMQLAQGVKSVIGFDLSHRTVRFDQRNVTELNRQVLTDSIQKLESRTVSLATLEKGGGAFLRTSLEGLLNRPESARRVFIVVASSFVFDRGADLDPVKLREKCNCRVYHLRFRHNVNDNFDDLEKILKPLAPRTFNLATGLDFRKALAEIIKDLENL